MNCVEHLNRVKRPDDDKNRTDKPRRQLSESANAVDSFKLNFFGILVCLCERVIKRRDEWMPQKSRLAANFFTCFLCYGMIWSGN